MAIDQKLDHIMRSGIETIAMCYRNSTSEAERRKCDTYALRFTNGMTGGNKEQEEKYLGLYKSEKQIKEKKDRNNPIYDWLCKHLPERLKRKG